MTTYLQFCDRYDLDPKSERALEEWREYRENLEVLESLVGSQNSPQASPEP